MAQETSIGNLNSSISDEDSKLVDSILNDINSTNTQQRQQPQQQPTNQPQQGQGQPSPEQMKMMQQQQMAMRQQQMLQQQQQMAQQQQMSQKNDKTNVINGNSNDNIIENIKSEAKNIMTVIFLCILFNIEQVDNLFKSQSMFVTEGGTLNMQAVFIKAVLIGVVFYGIKVYLL